MSLAKLRLSPNYGKLAKFEASEEGQLSLAGLSDADFKTVKQICGHLDLVAEKKGGGKVIVTKPGHDFFEALDVAAPEASDKAGLAEYVARGDLIGAEKLAKRGTVSHSNLFTSLLALPQGTDPGEGCRLLTATSATADWPSAEARKYFSDKARQAILLFLGEGKERLAEAKSKDIDALTRSGRCHLDVMLRDGRVKGEILVATNSKYGGNKEDKDYRHTSRGILAGDCASVRPMDGGHMTECEVMAAQPLILRPMVAPPPGTTGSGRTFRVDALANRQQFARTLTAVHLCSAPESKDGNCAGGKGSGGKGGKGQRRVGLAAKNRPSDDVLEVLLGATSKAAKVKDFPQCEEKAILKGLNASQTEAVSESTSRCWTLVQGPPGTGKTTVAVRILKAWVGSKQKKSRAGILCSSDSNIAVDNIVEGLAKAGVRVVRVGRPEAARPEVLEHCAEEIACKSLQIDSRDSNLDYNTRERLKQATQDAIAEADVVCCTAVGAGSVFLNDHTFSRVLFDEAAQATELTTLVPICRGAVQVVLCGDQCQLPPTISVDSVRDEGLNISLFERLTTASHKPHVLLEAQHRMHPAISAFSRAAFYGGRLLDGISSEDRPAPEGFRWPKRHMPLCFMESRGREHREGESFVNDTEADLVVKVVKQLLKGGLDPMQVGIVTPYAAQVRLLRSLLSRAGLPTSREKGGVETNSVDGYQGREKEAIVMSTVRSSTAGGLGFVADWRRANVAFTRARRGLVVIGDPETLGREATTWAPWLRWMQRAGCCEPPDCLEKLPTPRGDMEAVGLNKDSKESQKLIRASAEAWSNGRTPEEAVKGSRKRKDPGSEGSDSDDKKTKKSKSDKKKIKKEKKKEKKRKKKEKNKNNESDSTSSSSS